MSGPNTIRFTHPLLPPLDKVQARLEEIWREGWLTNRGRQHDRLEAALKGTLRCDNLSLVCNGTMALLLGLRALRLKGEVITTPFTFPATVHAIEWAGLTPVFCDIDPQTHGLDPKRVEEAITDKTCAILALHAYGIPCDVEALEQIARNHGLKLIFDAAHAFGTEVNGIPIGHFGDMSMFSFHATKLFHTAEGGALVFRDDSLGSQLRLIQNFGIQNEDHVVLSGINGKMNEIQAALGLCVLEQLDEERTKREAIATNYLARLNKVPGVDCVLPGREVKPSYQYFPIRIGAGALRSRDEVFGLMRAEGIYARRYFHPLCSRADCYAELPSASPENLPHATVAAQEILCLPFYGGLSDLDVERVCAIVRG
jgi:dTDP-4-amino-4,6-dideoxygalactose transaminase